MPDKKPKLPKVWVEFRDGVAWDVYSTEQKLAGFHLYAPVQKPKVCVWTQAVEDTSSYHASCGEDYVSLSNRAKFCYCCGGGIKAKK